MRRTIIFTMLWLMSTMSIGQGQINEMEAWNYEFDVNEVTLDEGKKISYVDEGDGDEVILFIHGLGSNLQAWNKNIAELSGQMRCLAVDLPGYGKSGKYKDQSFTMTGFADALVEFLDKLSISSVHLVGHSMGGQISVHLVHAYPHRVESLTLVAPAGFELFTETDIAWFKAVVTPDIVMATPREQVVRNFNLNFFDMPEDAQFMIEDRFALMENEKEFEHYCHMIPKCVQAMLDEPVFHLLPEIEIPVLIFYGENDALIPNAYLHPDLNAQGVFQQGANQLPHAKVVSVSEAGHFAHWEKAAAFNRELRDHVRQTQSK